VPAEAASQRASQIARRLGAGFRLSELRVLGSVFIDENGALKNARLCFNITGNKRKFRVGFSLMNNT